MFQKTTDLFKYIGLSLFGVAVVLASVHMIGEVHGLILTVIILFNQSALAFVQISALRRELNDLRQQRGETDEQVAHRV